MQMNLNIFQDLAWQFEAYRNGGLAAIQTAYEAGNSGLDQFANDAWGKIDSGIQTSDPNLIKQGNRDLLQREQKQVLDDGYRKLNGLVGATTLMSILAKNPVEYGRDFAALEPGSDITFYPSRWDWITQPTNGMWPLWLDEFPAGQLYYVSIPLKTRALTFTYLLLFPIK